VTLDLDEWGNLDLGPDHVDLVAHSQFGRFAALARQCGFGAADLKVVTADSGLDAKRPMSQDDLEAFAALLPTQNSGPADLTALLQEVSDTIVASLGFEIAVVNIVANETSMLVAAVTGPDDVRRVLLNRRQGMEGWQKLLAASEPWGQLRFLDHAKSPEDPADILTWIPDIPASDEPGAWHPEDALFAPLIASDGRLLGMLSVDVPRDGKRPGPTTRRALEALTITAALAIEHASLAAQSRRSIRQFDAVFDSSPVAIALLDESLKLVSVNAAYCAFLDRERKDLIGHLPSEFTHPDDVRLGIPEYQNMRLGLGRRRTRPIDKRYVLPDGSVVWGRQHLADVPTDDEPLLVIAQIEDITDRKSAEALLVQQAYYDALTGLPNRAESMRRLREAIAADHAHGLMTAVFFCDLDRLKLVNDTHGHATGDSYIREVSCRIRDSVRDTDAVGRLSGDEFVVVVRGIESPTEAIGLAGRIVEQVRQPLCLAGERFAPSLSLGIAFSAGSTTTADELLAQADSAMYRAKVEERGAWHVYDASMRNSAASQLALRNDLAEAIEQHDFRLYYQPIVALATRQTIGYEALLRWQHPRRGFLPPSEFLQVVLDSEYETAITDWVINQACADANRLPVAGCRVTVNVSSLQIGRRDLPEVVQRCLSENRLEPERLVLELTEDRLLSRPDGADLLAGLKKIGVRLAIDDFGTGYAGLEYLQRFPSLDIMKLDRSFVATLDSPISNHIIAAMVSLADAGGLRLITEGVETEEQAAQLRTLGVQSAQGYLFGVPLPLD
jgi:diguanylate cyclase (GGDEF)-like protein/PAS domain S-box-containing protein